MPKHAKRPELFGPNVEAIEPELIIGGMPAVLIVKPLITAKGLSFQLLTVQVGKDDGVRYGGGQRSGSELLESLEAPDLSDGEDVPEEKPAAKQVELPVAAKAAKKSKGELNLSKLA